MLCNPSDYWSKPPITTITPFSSNVKISHPLQHNQFWESWLPIFEGEVQAMMTATHLLIIIHL